MEVESEDTPQGDDPNPVLENGGAASQEDDMVKCFFPNCSERVPKTQVIQPIAYETFFISDGVKSDIGDYLEYKDEPICERCENERRRKWAKFNCVSFTKFPEQIKTAWEATSSSVRCNEKELKLVRQNRNSTFSRLCKMSKFTDMLIKHTCQENTDFGKMYNLFMKETKKSTETESYIVDLCVEDDSDGGVEIIGENQLPKDPKRNKLYVGNAVFYADGCPQNPWREGIISKVVVNANKNLYVVKDSKETRRMKCLPLNQLAYIDAPEEPILKHANRVLVKQSHNAYISGIILYLEKNMGQEQIYQVHLDNGETQNCPHSSIRVICAQSSDEVWKDVAKAEQSYVKFCLNMHPSQLMIKQKEGETVRVHNVPECLSAIILKIESKIAYLRYESGKEESIHVGSPRFKGIRNAVTSGSDNLTSSEKHGRIIKVDMSERAKEMNFVPHTCSPTCYIRRGGPNPKRFHYNFEKCKKYPVYAIPIFLGWKRQILSARTISKVSYQAPCGRRLPNVLSVLKYLNITKSDLEISFFTFDPNVRTLVMFEALNVKWMCDDYSKGKEMIPVSCVNSVNTDSVDYVEYGTKKRIHLRAHFETDTNFLRCCDCKDNCQDKLKCQCQLLTIAEEQHLRGRKDMKISIGYQFRTLPEVVASGIYECNSNCSCRAQLCLNRVVQFPLRNHLQIFKTEEYGWGVRTLIDLPRGAFVCIYVGNLYEHDEGQILGQGTWGRFLADLDLIEVAEDTKENYEENVPELEFSDMDNDSDEAETPEGIELKEGEKDEESNGRPRPESSKQVGHEGEDYVSHMNPNPRRKRKRRSKSNCNGDGDADADADKNASQDSEDKPPNTSRKYFGPNQYPYIVDSMDYGNLGRFLNHSCAPNLVVQNCFVDSHDIRYPWVTFFTSKYVSAGTELRWNYGYEEASSDEENHEADKQYFDWCKCGSSICSRKRIFVRP